MFTRPKRAGEEVEARVQFDKKNRLRFLSHAVKAVRGAKKANNEDEEIKTEKFYAKENETELKDLSSENSDSGTEEIEQSDSETELYNRVTRIKTDTVEELEKLRKEEEIKQKQWNQLSEFLQKENLRSIKSGQFPKTIQLPSESFTLPIFEKSDKLTSIIVEKRFSSRKLPHLLTLCNDNDEKIQYIFKEDDDISMDVAVMELLSLTNQIWESRKCPAKLQTYNVVSTINNTGFCECIAGQTMLVADNDVMLKQLGKDPEQWEQFYYSIIGIMVATTAFDITDRHDANAMFTPSGDIALIDLSASLGKKAPLDLVLGMNPIYFPLRIKDIHRKYKELSGEEPISKKLGWKFWDEVEEDAVVSYFALYNNYSLRNVLKECNYSMPKPLNFMKKLDERRHNNVQRKEKIRNDIVQSMEDSDAVSKFVSTVCHILPGN